MRGPSAPGDVDHIVFHGPAGRCGATRDTDLRVHVLDVVFGRSRRDEKLRRDLPCGPTVGDEAQHLDLSAAQAPGSLLAGNRAPTDEIDPPLCVQGGIAQIERRSGVRELFRPLGAATVAVNLPRRRSIPSPRRTSTSMTTMCGPSWPESAYWPAPRRMGGRPSRAAPSAASCPGGRLCAPCGRCWRYVDGRRCQ